MKTLMKMVTAMFLTFLVLVTAGCGIKTILNLSSLPPVLAEDEAVRPYTKLGRVKITREVYGIADYMTDPDIKKWAANAVRNEAEKMGADAVIQLEVTGATTNFLSLPTTEYRASGVAIKFK